MAKFVVNAGGAVHSVPDATTPEYLAERNLIEATQEQVAAWYAAQGLQPDGSPQPTVPTGKGNK